MRLEYIELHGFKSFPDKVRLSFEKGFTAVVGPNGSGKSNVSDAVRWVLGEQSNKTLRGGKMEDVIFHGAQMRNAMGFASVTLCLDNSDGRLADMGPQVSVSRRYYRSGDSEYLINGATVRLRDVRELFMDTGLGRDGYSVIGQGRIAEIVGAKSTERREIFEEAAGIAKYRFRKNEADRKLEAAQGNLERINDILSTLSARVGPLERQMKRAKEFLSIADRKKGLEITLYCDEMRRMTQQLRENNDKLVISKQDRQVIEQKLTELRNSVEHNEQLVSRAHVTIDEANTRISLLSQQSAADDSEAAVCRNDIQHNLAQIQRIQGESDAYSGQLLTAQEGSQRLKDKLAGKQAELAAADARISEAADSLSALITENELRETHKTETAQLIAELTARLTQLRIDEVADRSIIEQNAARLAQLAQSLDAQSDKKSEYDAQLNAKQQELAQIDASLNDAENRKRGFTAKQASRTAEFEAAQTRKNELNFSAESYAHRIKVLRDLDRNMDGFAESVKRVISAGASREIPGIVGTVASLINIRAGCETAIEVALGAALQNIVVKTERDAKQAITYLKDSKAGRATFLPMDTIRPSRFDGAVSAGQQGVVDVAANLVDCDGDYRDIVSFLLGRIVVAEDMDAASAAAKRMGYRYRVVTLDGQVVNAGGSYTGGYLTRGLGVFSRRGEIEQLGQKQKQAERDKADIEQKIRAQYAELQQIAAEITALDSDILNLTAEKARAETELAQFKRENGEWQLSYNTLCAERDRLDADSLSRGEALELADGKIQNTQSKLDELNASAREQSESGEEYVLRRSEMQDELGRLKILRAELQKDIENLSDALTGSDERETDFSRIKSQLAAQIDELAAANGALEQQVKKLEQQKTAAQSETEMLREEIAEAVRMRMLKESKNTALRGEEKQLTDQREGVSGETARLEARLEALEGDRERLNTELWEQYELTRSEAEKLCVPFDDINELRAQVTALKSKIKSLGNVNLGAIEEYAEVSAQYKQLKEQYDDVDASRKELSKLISSLTTEMKTLFDESFVKINENFRHVFTQMFGGGNARLFLTDEADTLESGIEMDVQPPGKIIKNLSELSGGEQALVAIALYFAMLAVNPSPFCVLDEIDSALDDANVARFAEYLQKIMDKTQFIVITHKRGTMELAGALYGVTMQEDGVSKLLKMDNDNIDVNLVG